MLAGGPISHNSLGVGLGWLCWRWSESGMSHRHTPGGPICWERKQGEIVTHWENHSLTCRINKTHQMLGKVDSDSSAFFFFLFFFFQSKLPSWEQTYIKIPEGKHWIPDSVGVGLLFFFPWTEQRVSLFYGTRKNNMRKVTIMQFL